jgi:outer membrane protein assembly factor BamB
MRNKFRRLTGLWRHAFNVSILIGITALVTALAPAADWPQFLGPARDAISSETGLLASWPAEGPPLIWEKAIGEGYSGPVVSGSSLFLFHRVGDTEVVQCLEAATGKERWKTEYPTEYSDDYGKGNGPRSTPVVSGNRIYVLGAEGKLHCLDAGNGKIVWRHVLHEDYQARKSFFGVGTSPLIEGDVLLVNVGAKNAGIVAFNKDTGKEVWKATDHAASYSSPVAATIQGTRQVFFFTREGLVSVNPADGAVRFTKPWRARIQASVNAATPLVVDDHLFLSASYNTGAVWLKVRPDGVDEVWKGDNNLSNHYATSIHAGGFLYGFHGRQEEIAEMRCVEAKTGKVRWVKERFGCGSMILAEGRLIILTETGNLVLVEASPDAYKELARAHVLNRFCRAQVALSDGRLFARDDRKLICLNLKK